MTEVRPASGDEVRVGDADRRAVDERLRSAVGEGLLSLAEYDERAAALWASRTRGELRTLTADLPSPPPAVVTRPRRRRHRRGWCAVAAVGAATFFLLPARTEVAGMQGVEVSVDGVSIGDGGTFVRKVLPHERTVDVPLGYDEVTVVVPDRLRAEVVRPSGAGEVECEDACAVASDDVVRVLVPAGVSDVEIETVSEHDD